MKHTTENQLKTACLQSLGSVGAVRADPPGAEVPSCETQAVKRAAEAAGNVLPVIQEAGPDHHTQPGARQGHFP